MEASSQIQNLLVSVIVASVWQLFSLSDFGPSWSEVEPQTETEETI